VIDAAGQAAFFSNFRHRLSQLKAGT